MRKYQENRKTSNNYSLVRSLSPKMKVLSILAKKSLKIKLKLFLWCVVSHENWSLSQIFFWDCRFAIKYIFVTSQIILGCYRTAQIFILSLTRQNPFQLRQRKQKISLIVTEIKFLIVITPHRIRRLRRREKRHFTINKFNIFSRWQKT